MKKNKNQTGFTILELVISLAISMILFLIVVGIYSISQQAYNRTDTKAELTQNGRVILDRMIREIRQAQDIKNNIPLTNSDPNAMPTEIIFQDGHDATKIRYIHYFLNNPNNGEISRQEIVYYFDSDPTTFVHWYDTDQNGYPPGEHPSGAKVIGEYVDDLEFWGERSININLYLLKNGQSETISTVVYGRNL